MNNLQVVCMILQERPVDVLPDAEFPWYSLDILHLPWGRFIQADNIHME